MVLFGKRIDKPTISTAANEHEKPRIERGTMAPLNTHTATEAEHRTKTRKRILMAGVISYNDNHFTIACAVRNISESGARIKIMDKLLVPDTFTLLIELDAIKIDCEVIWRNDKEIGVKFVSTFSSAKHTRMQVVYDCTPAPAGKSSIRRNPVK